MKLLDCLPSNDKERREIMEYAKMCNKGKFQSNNFALVLKSVSTELIPENNIIKKLDNLR